MLLTNENGEFKFDHFYVTQEGEHYSIRCVHKNGISTFYSEDNEVIAFRESGRPRVISLPGEGQLGAKFITALIDGLTNGDVEIAIPPTINKNELISVLEKKRSDVLEP